MGTTLFFVSIVIGTFVLYETLRITFYSWRAVQNGKSVEPASQLVQNPRWSILVIGDSTSYGTGASRKEYSLVGRLSKDFPDASITNASKNAMNLKELAHTLKTFSDKGEAYDNIMIHIGGIDTISFTPMRTIEKYLTTALICATAMARKKVFLVSVNNSGLAPLFHFPLSLLYTRRSRAVTRRAKTLCNTHGVIHIPLFEEREYDALHKDRKRFFSNDQTHPNDEGYALWYEKIRRVIIPHVQKS